MNILFIFFGFGIAYFLVLRLVMPKGNFADGKLSNVKPIIKNELTEGDALLTDPVNSWCVANLYHND